MDCRLARGSMLPIAMCLAVLQAFSDAIAVADEKSAITIRLTETSGGGQEFEVSGLSAADRDALAKMADDAGAWQRRFAVYAVPDGGDNLDSRPAMLGRYATRNQRLYFKPRYSLEPGVRYLAVFRHASTGDAAIQNEFEIPVEPALKPTKIEAIFPSANRLPENQLKFYLHFSAPMSRGEAYEHVKLLDAKGIAVELPFLELGEELWAPGARRFTLFFDPGRIKRGLRPREEVGPALEEGKTYTLVVDADWRDAAGRPLAGEMQKTFSVGPPDDAPPDPAGWKITAPAAGERKPLEVRFPEPLDRALLERLLRVETEQGAPLPGEIFIDRQETRWHFEPREAWRSGRYQLVATKTLEDLAGNSIGRPFEVDELKPVTETIASDEVRLPFEVK